MEAEHIPEWEPTPEQVKDGYLDGWFIFTADYMPSENRRHIEVFRTLTPTARIGNAAVYHGRFYLPYGCGGILIRQAMLELDKPKGDRSKVELYLRRGVTMTMRIRMRLWSWPTLRWNAKTLRTI